VLEAQDKPGTAIEEDCADVDGVPADPLHRTAWGRPELPEELRGRLRAQRVAVGAMGQFAPYSRHTLETAGASATSATLRQGRSKPRGWTAGPPEGGG
jgi:hypothetical protein